MLVLSRKQQEAIYIGPDICVTVVAIQNGKVRLGFEAPSEIPILREELQKSSSFEKRDFPIHAKKS